MGIYQNKLVMHGESLGVPVAAKEQLLIQLILDPVWNPPFRIMGKDFNLNASLAEGKQGFHHFSSFRWEIAMRRIAPLARPKAFDGLRRD